MKVKRNKNGMYRVYAVVNEHSHKEVRYAKKADAVDYIRRCGGYVCYEDFDDLNKAKTYLDELSGQIWW